MENRQGARGNDHQISARTGATRNNDEVRRTISSDAHTTTSKYVCERAREVASHGARGYLVPVHEPAEDCPGPKKEWREREAELWRSATPGTVDRAGGHSSAQPALASDHPANRPR